MELIALKSRRWLWITSSIVILVVGVLAGAVMTAYTSWLPLNQKGEDKVPVYVSASAPLPSNVSLTDGLAPIARTVRQSVVSIFSTKVVRTRPSPFFDDPMFRRFFGREFDQQPREQRQPAQGSGVIISPDGYILTNNHVVSGASELKITFADKREMDAKIIGTDAPTDLAVIKVDAKGLAAMPLGDSKAVQVGDFVLAVGNPFGLGHTVTFGIVSATGRGSLGIAQYEDFIQTDAAINPGNSGGALVNMRGQLIGINTAIFTDGGFERGNQGVGFTIPIHMAREVMDQILRKGKVVRGYLGLLPRDINPTIGERFGLKGTEGALVESVSPDTPAEKAGIKHGDIILEFNGQKIKDADDLRNKVAQAAPGTKAEVKLLRNGQERTVEVELALRPDPPSAGQPQEELSRDNPLSGIDVEDLTPELSRRLSLPLNVDGVVIMDVDPGSSAAEEGLRPGDVIQEIDRRPIRNVADFRQAAARAAGKDVLLFIYNHQARTTQYVVLKPRK
jgi:serine protease Do